jgi:hypothetical protein
VKTAEQHCTDWERQVAPVTAYHGLHDVRIAWIREIQREAWDAGALAMRAEARRCCALAEGNHANVDFRIDQIDTKLEGRP